MRSLSKPQELLDLHSLTETLFNLIREQFDVGATYVLKLATVDAGRKQLVSVEDVAALTMRRLQALRLVATSGHPTASDVVMGLCGPLIRSLEELARASDDEAIASRLRHGIAPIGEAAVAVGELSGMDEETVLI